MSIRALNPYDVLPPVPAFSLTSTDMSEGSTLATPQLSGVFGAGGSDLSPHLSWAGFPLETQSFAVTCFDPDAPTGSGFWHWTVFDIASSVTSLAAGAGAADGSGLPAGAKQVRNDAGIAGFLGAAPPPGHGTHRYIFAVHALSVAQLGPDDSVSNAIVGFNMFGKVLARATLTAVFER
jgi:Raf kinase inhibitor-like YbhB/YbcL family protein